MENVNSLYPGELPQERMGREATRGHAARPRRGQRESSEPSWIEEVLSYNKHLVDNYRERHEVMLRRRKWWLYAGNRRKDKWYHWKRPKDNLSAGTRGKNKRLRRLRRSEKIKRRGYLLDCTNVNDRATVKRKGVWHLKQYVKMQEKGAQYESEEEKSDDEAMTEDEDWN